MSTLLNNLGRISELDAVNTVLVSSGESPYPDNTVLENVVAPDVLTALKLLKDVAREMQMEPWEFNTEIGRLLDPGATFNFLNNDTSHTLVNIFPDPGATYMAWSLTRCQENRGLDVDVRLSTQYTSSGNQVAVIYDKRNHRDGPEASKHPYLYLDVQYVKNFDLLPEEAKRYISVVASRRFCQQTLGSAEKGTFTAADESAALRLLKRAHGRPEQFNIKNNPEVQAMLGFRGDARYSFTRRLRNKGG
jgi:hypothetical protein